MKYFDFELSVDPRDSGEYQLLAEHRAAKRRRDRTRFPFPLDDLSGPLEGIQHALKATRGTRDVEINEGEGQQQRSVRPWSDSARGSSPPERSSYQPWLLSPGVTHPYRPPLAQVERPVSRPSHCQAARRSPVGLDRFLMQVRTL